MSVEKANNISELVSTNPTIQDPVHNGADHFWLLKNVLKKQFPGKSGNGFAAQIVANEDEFNYLKGVRKSIQDQIDDLAAGASDSAFAKGTAIVFAQPVAPTGWTQFTDSEIDNRMMRVVSTSGGNVGGTDSPILNNMLPEHFHVFTTGDAGGHQHSLTISNSDATHSHQVSIQAADINHTHSFQTDQAGDHSHGLTTNGSGDHQHSGVLRPGPTGFRWPYSSSGTDVGYGLADGGGNHSHSGNTDTRGAHIHHGSTSGMSSSTSHTHGGQASSGSATHNHMGTVGLADPHHHSGTTDPTGKKGGWEPRYIDVIIAAKSK